MNPVNAHRHRLEPASVTRSVTGGRTDRTPSTGAPPPSAAGVAARPSVIAALLAAVALAVPATAAAGRGGSRSGALGSVTSSVAGRTGSSPSSGGASSGSSSGASGATSGRYTADGYYIPYQCVGCVPAVVVGGAPGAGTPPGPSITELTLELGVASVRDSDGAARAAFRMLSGRMGLGVEGSHYFERDRAGSGEWIRMNLWSVVGVGNAIDGDRARLGFTAGIAGTSSTAFEPLLGPTVGAELAYRLTGPDSVAIAPLARARWFAFEKGITAHELMAGARISRFTLGWRYLEFSTDDTPLQGPEVGVSFQF